MADDAGVTLQRLAASEGASTFPSPSTVAFSAMSPSCPTTNRSLRGGEGPPLIPVASLHRQCHLDRPAARYVARFTLPVRTDTPGV